MRFSRAGTPAFAFAVVGGLLLLLVPTVLPPIVGGLAGVAGYGLALQLVLTLFLLTAVDDFQDVRVPSSWRAVTESAFDLHRTIPRYYRTKPVPAAFLAFGVAATLAALVIGLVDGGPTHGYLYGTLVVRVSVFTMAALLLLTALVQVRRFGNGFFGWCTGFALGVAFAEIQFSAGTVVESTFLGWLGYAAGLCLVAGVGLVVMALRRRTREG